ncbi:hypothetical protein ZYGR_0AF03140 [Zygosaccharomyces rouxii]|uniref:Uncharacterized protein n=1 Tax=Zygosaccharomyces rouxii TaxID=4956 RepID=A0A1Q3A8G2_ZYGRO|nr:hypothetical protein ZYGR_0AF03140 [Zygosaccharomyces rouxii]
MFHVQCVALLPRSKESFAFLSLLLLGGKFLKAETRGSWIFLYCQGENPECLSHLGVRKRGGGRLGRVVYSNGRNNRAGISHVISWEEIIVLESSRLVLHCGVNDIDNDVPSNLPSFFFFNWVQLGPQATWNVRFKIFFRLVSPVHSGDFSIVWVSMSVPAGYCS